MFDTTSLFSSPIGAVSVGAIIITILMVFLINHFTKSSKSSSLKEDSLTNKTNGAVQAPAFVDPRQRFSIVFGTQTGTAERFSKSLKSQLQSKFNANAVFDVIDIENYDAPIRLAKEKIVFLLLATYGDGEPTDDATEFYNWLNQQAEQHADDAPFKDVTFAVFGLGNRQYEHFCAVGKKVHKLMQQLGGTPIVKAGEGDDDRDIDEDFDGWCSILFDALDASPLITNNTGKEGQGGLSAEDVPAYTVTEIKDAPVASVDVIRSGNGLTHHTPYLATISTVKELHTKQSERSCVHVEIDISGMTGGSYEAGDHIGIFAENSPDVVASAAKMLGYSLDTCFRLSIPAGNPDNLVEINSSGPVTLRCALARYADLLSAPSKGALQALAAFATDPTEAANLRQLASIEGREAFHSYIITAKRSLLSVMEDHPSVCPPLGAFFASIAPHLQPRFYSISSSPKQHPTSVHVTCAVVTEQMPCGRIHHGVASHWLASAASGQKVAVFIRHSSFKLPKDLLTPIIMVGPGTGVAPFRGFIQEREALTPTGVPLGPAHLFFGCRHRLHDYIYEQELESALSDGALTALHVAFSREGATKDYVQHHVEARAVEIWSLLEPKKGKGYLYVCGDAKNMAKDVHSTLHKVAVKATGCSEAEAEVLIKALSDSGRYLKDVW